MRKLTLLIFCIILLVTLLPQTANGQWYSRQYSVDSISELTENQYNSALLNADRNMKIIKTMTIVGLGMTVAGAGVAGVGFIVLMDGMTVERFRGQFDIAITALVGGLVISQLGIIPLGVAIPIAIIGKKRKSDLEKVFGKTMSQFSISPSINWYQNKGFIGARITLPLNQ